MDIRENPINISDDAVKFALMGLQKIISDEIQQKIKGGTFKEYLREICREEITKNAENNNQ